MNPEEAEAAGAEARVPASCPDGGAHPVEQAFRIALLGLCDDGHHE